MKNDETNDNTDKTLTKSTNQFPVVGIGASAGGLDAFKKLLKAIPEDSGMAYVLVQHLHPGHESFLTEILQKVTKIPVVEISDNIRVEPNHIYIIPSNKMLIANDGKLELSPRPEKSKNKLNLPIDLFFASLAEIHQTHAIGVVLSGTASDGTLGLKAIKDNGGITIAQDASAEYDGMPQSAIYADVVDFVLAPDDIPKKLSEVIQKIKLNEEDLDNLPKQEEETYKQILTLLRLRKGTDFTYYKQTTVRRRILRRMAITKTENVTDYLALSRLNKAEQDALYQDLLIPVTSFFRERKVFENLCETIFPTIVKNKDKNTPIRIWVAACSTGEEAYSIAICLKEFLGESHERVQIFATDISVPAITKARTGAYTKGEVEKVSEERLAQFFTKTDVGFRINKELRDMCVFAVHNFLKDPPFGKIDFVSCRNVLIYMEQYLQKKAFSTFHYALNPHGYLLLGKSETSNSMPDLFSAIVKHDKLFVKKDAPSTFMHVASPRSEKSVQNISSYFKSEPMQTDFQKTADEIILSKYTPAGVVVNDAMDIVHFRGNTNLYLEQASGKPSHNLLKMARSGLAFELRNIVHKTKKLNGTVLKENIVLNIDNVKRFVDIEAMPIPNMVDPHYLILFHDNQTLHISTPEIVNGNGKSTLLTEEKDLYIKQIERELTQTREDMRSITEDQEAANEELQSANEELLSGSEELQSLNEELETSKEELQSSNEELTVVNQELISLNEQITTARRYAESIVATIREPLLVLDKNLRIRSANKSFYSTFHIQKKDTEGILIYDLADKHWNIPALRTLLSGIVEENKTFTDFEVVHNFPLVGKKILLLNAREVISEMGAEKFILLAIEDVTEQKKYRLKDDEFLGRFKNILLQVSVGISIFKGINFHVEMANEAFLQIVGMTEKDFVGKNLFETMPETRSIAEPILYKVLKSGTPHYIKELEYTVAEDNNEKGYYNLVYQPMFDDSSTITGIICITNDITDVVLARKQMEAQATMVQDLLLNAPAIICTLTGPTHVYDLVNERYQALFGKRKLQGKTFLDALPEMIGQGFDALLDKVYETGETFVGIDVPATLIRDEGLAPQLCYFNFSYQPIYNDNKQISGVLLFGYEVTEQVIARNKNLETEQAHSKELEEKVQQRTVELLETNELLNAINKEKEKRAAELIIANRELLHESKEKEKRANELRIANKELVAFNYISSHDLQEPLRKIQTFASLIAEQEANVLSAKGKDYFFRMEESAKRMQTLIEDLLAYSRTNVTDRNFVKRHLNIIVDEVTNEMSDFIKQKNTTIELSDLCEIDIIPFQMRQVLNNLITNAIKFILPGKAVHITINCKVETATFFADEIALLSTETLSTKKDYCRISFKDNGIGFDSQYKDKIFEVFQRLHGKDAYPGTGIGLAIVKKIVQNHNGIITAEGKVNEGATFSIYLPVLQ